MNSHQTIWLEPAFRLRPVRESDRPALQELVSRIPDSLTTLPNDADFLERRIHASLRAFYPHISEPGAEHYLFVAEDLESQRIVGTSGLVARVGGFEPFYTYEVRTEVQTYQKLDVQQRHRVLHLKRSHKGPSELCSLFLHPEQRREGTGRLLSMARFLFIHAFPERFAEELIAELRGYLNPSGESPFWEAVGKQFFRNDFYTADVLSGLGEKEFIEALMPRHPIYVCLLPPAAQTVLGHVHPDTRPAQALLEQQGFHATQEIDIFDAGPVMAAKTSEIPIMQEIQSATCAIGPLAHHDTTELRRCLVANPRIDFRAVRIWCLPPEDGVLHITAKTAQALEADEGESLNYVFT